MENLFPFVTLSSPDSDTAYVGFEAAVASAFGSVAGHLEPTLLTYSKPNLAPVEIRSLLVSTGRAQTHSP